MINELKVKAQGHVNNGSDEEEILAEESVLKIK